MRNEFMALITEVDVPLLILTGDYGTPNAHTGNNNITVWAKVINNQSPAPNRHATGDRLERAGFRFETEEFMAPAKERRSTKHSDNPDRQAAQAIAALLSKHLIEKDNGLGRALINCQKLGWPELQTTIRNFGLHIHGAF